MISALSIHNFALIEHLTLDFSKGLTVFSGESGAGKTIILDAINFVLGVKSSNKISNANMFKNSSLPMSIDLEIKCKDLLELQQILEQQGINAVDDTIILRRIMNPDGRAKTFLNESMISVALLEIIAPYIVEISGQHNQYSLLNEKNHLIILDEYARIVDEVSSLASLFDQLTAARLELKQLSDMQSTAAEDRSYLEHMIREIREIDPQKGEEQELSERRQLLLNQARIKDSLTKVLSNLSGNNGALDSIYMSQKLLAKFSEQFTELVEKINSISIELEEVTSLSKAYLEKFNNLGDLEEVERRLFVLKDLARKHSVSTDELGMVAKQMEEKIQFLSHMEENISLKQAKVESLNKSYLENAERISKKRNEAALLLRSAVLKEFSEIKMDKADFTVDINKKSEENYDKTGIDSVRFLIKSNPGSPFCSIKEVASGGELARIMLACKLAMIGVRSIATMIFDEIDSGIGGAVASSVGKKLAALARSMQVIVITHQPQVAAYSKQHYLVSKKHLSNNTSVEVLSLSQQDKIKEIARMLAGEVLTSESISAAASLIDNAKV